MPQEKNRSFAHALFGRARRWRQRAQVRSGYKAFISYKHEGSSLPEILETAIKRYAKPLLAPPMRIFRDEKYIVPTSDLPGLINTALEASEFLILLASPAASDSPWVRAELDQWCRVLGRSNRLIIVWLSGTIDCDADKQTLVWETSTALPGMLRPYYPRVPFFLDFTKLTDSPDLTLEHPEFRRLINLIVARLRYLEPADMSDTAILEHQRNLRLRNSAVASLAALTVLSMVATVIAVKQREEARRQAATALSRQLAAQSSELMKTRGDLPLAALLAAESRRRDPQTSEAFDAANQVLELLPFQKDFSVGHPIEDAAFAAAGSKLVVQGQDGVELWDTDKGKSIRSFEGLSDSVGRFELNLSGTRLALVDDCDIAVYDAENGKRMPPLRAFTPSGAASPPSCLGIHEISASDDGERVAFQTPGVANVWNVQSGKVETFKSGERVDGARPLLASSGHHYTVDPGRGGGYAMILQPDESKPPRSPVSIPLEISADVAFDHDLMAVTSYDKVEIRSLTNPDPRKTASISLSRYVSISDDQLRYPPAGYFAFGARPVGGRSPWMVLAAGSLGKITTWRFDPDRLVVSDSPGSVISHEGTVGIRFSDSADYLLSWSRDNTASLWRDGLEVLRVAHEDRILAATFGKGGEVWTVDASGRVRSSRLPCRSEIVSESGGIRVLSAEIVALPEGDERFMELVSADRCIDDSVNGVDGKYLAVWSNGSAARAAQYGDKGVDVLDLASHRVLLDVPFQNTGLETATGTFGHRIDKAAFSPDGKFLAIFESESHRARGWEVDTGRELVFGKASPGQYLFFTADAERFASILQDGNIAIARTRTGEIQNMIPWSIEQEQKPSRVSGIRCPTEPYASDACGFETRFAFSRDGRFLAEQEPEVRIWRVDGDKPVFQRAALAGLGFAYGSNTYVAMNDSRELEFLHLDDVVTSTRLSHLAVQRVALSPATPYVALVAADFLHLIDASNPGQEQVLALPHKTATRMVFSPDGQMLATGDSGGAVRIWQLTDSKWKELGASEYQGSVESLAFAPDNAFMMIGVEDTSNRTQVIHKLLVSQTAQLDEICRRLGDRSLSSEECSRFLDDAHCPAICATPPKHR